MGTERLKEIRQKIVKAEDEVGVAEQIRANMQKDQLETTENILRRNAELEKREHELRQKKAQKDYFKSQEIKNMHRKQDFKLKIKFFLDRILDKNRVDRKGLVGGIRTSENSRNSSARTGGILSPDQKRSLRLNKKKHRRKLKNQKLKSESGNCDMCTCRIF